MRSKPSFISLLPSAARLPIVPFRSLYAVMFIISVASGCTSVPLKQGGTLTSYGSLGAPKGKLSKSRIYVDGQRLAAVKTVSIMPTSFSFSAASHVSKEADRALVSNVLDRALCVALSDKYQLVSAGQPADLTIRSVITDIVPTNKAMAGVATAVTVGSGFALPSGVPVSVPRLPFGLGGLAVEAEAVDSSGDQSAAILWSRGANSFQDKPRYSEVGDAYNLASRFANDFSRILISGKEPKGLNLSLPSRQRMKSWFGGKPKYAACDAFGRAPGLLGAIAAKYGAPPEWADKRSKSASVR